MNKESTRLKRSFLTKARDWQRIWSKGHDCPIIENRKEVLLTKDAAKAGKNFYSDDFNIIKAVKNPQKFNNMLRSEHIPFNMFIPLDIDNDKEYCKKIFNKIIGNKIESIDDKLIIEYKPKPEKDYFYLKDNTSFDVYIEYTRIGGKGEKGIIGIEIKYTEREYKLNKKRDHEQIQKINDQESPYYKVTKKSNAYKEECICKLKEDNYRQIWRNHILGESIVHSPLQKDEKFKEFISITIYPEENEHFEKVSKEYPKFLNDEKKCLFITYEKLFDLFETHCKDMDSSKKVKYENWIKWMRERYIVN